MNERVTSNPHVYGGKPIISGTRIPVSVILNLLAHGYDAARVVTEYPDLTPEDVRAALSYAEKQIRGAVDQPIADAV